MDEPGPLRRALIDSLAGAISGGISRTVTSPLDVIKIRFQVQLEPTSSWALLHRDSYGSSKYTGILQSSKVILQEEEDHLKLSPYLPYLSGALAGCAATIGSYPFDLLRTILASQGEPKVYSTMRSAFLDIIRTRGIRGLYAGLSPTLVEIIPYAGLQIGSFDTFKRWMMAWNRYRFSNISPVRLDDPPSSFQLFLCGLAAGSCAKVICHPLDVVKKRFQIEGLQRHPKYGARVENHGYKNMYHALQQILRSEGWHGLYKGIFPSLIKSAPASAVTFVSYEYTSRRLESLLP
ncbi:hypothetical protein C4D60_Mb08t22830 [Musa balbisiana]|uniref:Mitochondrial carrier protein n=1 Tax=Musa balbisiana TaxID=52838 RepID=A0A4S8K5S0_MUSBA|nr:hypothetical protein C4D60_Mb08t22830 [Musa balbisiana]